MDITYFPLPNSPKCSLSTSVAQLKKNDVCSLLLCVLMVLAPNRKIPLEGIRGPFWTKKYHVQVADARTFVRRMSQVLTILTNSLRDRESRERQ
jgi:hypothetical protein